MEIMQATVKKEHNPFGLYLMYTYTILSSNIAVAFVQKYKGFCITNNIAVCKRLSVLRVFLQQSLDFISFVMSVVVGLLLLLLLLSRSVVVVDISKLLPKAKFFMWPSCILVLQ